MIKVIEHGRLRRSTCYTCGCIFTFEKQDVEIEQVSAITSTSKRFVKCPDCGEKIGVNL